MLRLKNSPGLRLRLALVGAFSITAATVTVGIVSYKQLERHGESELDRFLHTELSDFVRDYLVDAANAGLDRELCRQLIFAERNELFIILRDASGNELMRSDDLEMETVPFSRKKSVAEQTIEFADVGATPGSQLRMLTLDLGRNVSLPFRVIQGLMPRGAMDRNLTRGRHQLLVAIVASTTFGFCVCYLLAGSILAPLRAMARFADQIGPTNLSERLSLTKRGDEVDRVSSVLNSMLDRLESSFVHLESFTLDASHELRTPLTIMRGELEGAATSNDLKRLRTAISVSIEEADRLSRMITALLQLARLRHAVMPVGQNLDLGRILLDMADDAQVIAESRQVAFETNLAEAAGTIRGDRILLRQAIWNLVVNALDYTPTGGTVALLMQSADDAIQVEVTDTGPGIAPADLHRIFEPFYRGKDNDSPDGLGLGLALTRRIIECHAGTVAVESVPGRTRFLILLPSVPTSRGARSHSIEDG